MAATVQSAIPAKLAIDAKLARRPGAGGIIIFGLILAARLFYVATHLASDLSVEKAITIRSFLMLAGADWSGTRPRGGPRKSERNSRKMGAAITSSSC